MFLALDLGTTTGWAFKKNRDTKTESGSWKLKNTKPGERYDDLRKLLDRKHRKFKLKYIAYEHVMAHKGSVASHVYGGFLATLETWCMKHKVKLIPCAVGSIKKHATGNGRAKKEDMKTAARERGWDPVDDNEADALWIMDYALKELINDTGA